jgi:hypothetical protein
MLQFSQALADYEAGALRELAEAEAGRRRRRRRRAGLLKAVGLAAVLAGAALAGYLAHASRTGPEVVAGPPRPRVGPRAVQAAAHAYLARRRPAEREAVRFISLANLHNNPEVGGDDLRRYRAALGELAGALAGSSPEVALSPADERGVLFAVNIADLGWSAEDWEQLLFHYPYGVTLRVGEGLARQASAWAGSEQPLVRGDWLVGFFATDPARARFLRPAGGPLPEAVTVLGRRFVAEPVTLRSAAEELGLGCPDPLEDAIATGRLPAGLGLGPLAEGATVPRALWETPAPEVSPFHKAAVVLGLGTLR